MIFDKQLFFITTFLFLAFVSFSQQEHQNKDKNWKLFPSKDEKKQPLEVNFSMIKDSLIVDSAKIPEPAFVEIIQDYRVKQLLEKDKYLNEKKIPLQIEGYRIKIYFGSGAHSQTDANQAKAKFLQKFPEEKVYVKWDTPNYTTSVGNYRTKMDAEKFLKEMSINFPEGFIVPCKIDLPELTLNEK